VGQLSVLDIGSGTGVWAISAAKMGARRVVAIEQDQLLIGLIKKLAHENGVADRVEVIQGDSRQVQLANEFDVVISETIGNLVFDEQIVPIMIDARDRFLKPGGVLIPESVALVAAAGHFKKRHKRLPAGIPLEYGYFESLLLNHPFGLTDRARLKLMSDPKELLRADMITIKASPSLNDLTTRWKLKDANQINCFAVWADTTLTNDTQLTTIQTTSWTPVIYRINPFKEEEGELEFKLTLSETSNYWTATLSNDHSMETQSYSPSIASAALLANTRADFDLMSHFRRIGLAQ
ncbi:MAG TPA: class I SAM-dependent methyltransferase, partial [Blastocatellia bacterium]|nr:class I SAM-dependent methyltransferase [Blastocatellia bacterium]